MPSYTHLFFIIGETLDQRLISRRAVLWPFRTTTLSRSCYSS
jgi:hypothetical protein